MSVSRIEEHHLEALAEDSPLLEPSRGLWAARAAGDGFGLVAVIDAVPVAVLGVRFAEEGWLLHGLAVAADQSGPEMAGTEVRTRLLDAAEELARPLGSLAWEAGADAALAESRGYRPIGGVAGPVRVLKEFSDEG